MFILLNIRYIHTDKNKVAMKEPKSWNVKNNTVVAKISEILHIFTLELMLSCLLNFNENKASSRLKAMALWLQVL